MKNILFAVTGFLFLSCFVSHCLSRPISDSSNAAVASAGELGEDHWFHHHPWHFAHSPQSSKYWPKKPHGWKWQPDWPELAHSPFPCPWWPKKDSQNVEVAGDEIDAADPPLAA